MPVDEMRYSPGFDRFACRGFAAAIQQQEVIGEFLGAGGRKWAVDLGAGTMSGDGPTVSPATCLGSFSKLSDTWMWMWDHPDFGWSDPATAPLRLIYEVGEQLDIAEFTTGGFPLAEFADPGQAATMLAVAAGQVLGGRGVWGCGIDDGEGVAFVHLGDESLPAAQFSPVSAPRLLLQAAAAFPADPRSVVLGFAEHYRLKLELDPERIVLYGDHGSVTIDFDGRGRIVRCESDSNSPGD
jgi:hypothetical protein